jgi:lysine biosynthesis protein LysW
MAHSTCPSCDARVDIGPDPKMGQRLKCHFCKTELEVVWLDPVELDWPIEFEEDEIDYDDEYRYEDYDDDDDNDDDGDDW